MKKMLTVTLALLIVGLAGCKTAYLTQDQFPCKYTKDEILRGQTFISGCKEGIGKTAAYKELAHGLMVVTPTFGESYESYWYAFTVPGRICLLINDSLDDAQLEQVRNLGLGWQAQRVDEVKINNQVWAGKSFDQYTVVSFPAVCGNRSELTAALQSIISLGWLYNVTAP